MMKVDLTDKVALVTGAGQNIGKAIADLYAENGAKVIYSDINYEKVAKAASKYPECEAAHMDVTDLRQVESIIDEIVKKFGRIDILINNAGLNTQKHRVTIDQFPQEEWKRIMSVDLDGLYLVSKTVAGVMIKQGSGRIINISSSLGIVAARLQCAFIAAKSAVVSLTKAMALELAPYGILVNCIAPGSILTEGTKKLFYGNDAQFKEKFSHMLGSIPLRKPGEPDDIAYAALYLAATESAYVDGHVLVVDGGWTAGYIRDF